MMDVECPEILPAADLERYVGFMEDGGGAGGISLTRCQGITTRSRTSKVKWSRRLALGR
jgi:hypothetical protein